MDSGSDPVFFDQQQFALLESLVDHIVPETDTPGARGAGAHYFIDMMMKEWASADRQQRYLDGLRSIEQRSMDVNGASFLDTSAGQQKTLLTEIDREAFAADSGNRFFREFKHMVLFAYYSSEIGATEELQYEPLIAEYKACAPLDEVGGRTWFWMNFSHGL